MCVGVYIIFFISAVLWASWQESLPCLHFFWFELICLRFTSVCASIHTLGQCQSWLPIYRALYNCADCILITLPVLPVTRNHQGRRGTTADIGDNLLPSLTVFGCSLTAVEVETGPLSDVVFPSFLLPWYNALNKNKGFYQWCLYDRPTRPSYGAHCD